MKFCLSVYLKGLWFTIKPMESLLGEANIQITKVQTHGINPGLINRGMQMYRYNQSMNILDKYEYITVDSSHVQQNGHYV